MSLAQCNETLLRMVGGVGLNEGQICAYPDSESESFACYSGESLHHVSDDEKYYVSGVASFGVSCGEKLPTIYTRITHYLDWIEPIVWP